MAEREVRELNEPSCKFLVAMVFLAALLFCILRVDTEEGGAAEQQAEGQQQGLRVTQVIDAVVKNDRGEEVGEVDDLIVNRNGKIKQVVLSVGSFLGDGERMVAIPFRSLQITERGNIIYRVTKEQLEKYPKFNYREETSTEYYYPPSPSYRLPSNPLQEKTKAKYSPWEWEYFPERLRASAILNRTAWNIKGEELGDIDDLLINREGKVEEIILAVGGFKFLGVGERLVAIPFRPLKATDLGLIYNMTMEQLNNLPEFHYRKK
jgi:sporulation protein YlmC with PRC-barrel domain